MLITNTALPRSPVRPPRGGHPWVGVAAGRGQREGLWSPQSITKELLGIEPEKASSTAKGEAFMQALPGSGSAALLRTRVEDTQRRYERLVQLLDAAQEKWVQAGSGEAGRGQGPALPPNS